MYEVVAINDKYLNDAIKIWNSVVEDGKAFPQTECLTTTTAKEFFSSQTYTGVAVNKESEEVVGVYILHPNNVGRCGHICNASYAVKKDLRGQGIGELLVKDCIKKAGEYGFKILQFNAVVKTNIPAMSLYKKLGFTPLGVIPGGFLSSNGHYEDIVPHYIKLDLE